VEAVMAELARGTVADRPWGRTLAALGLRGVSGQLALAADAKVYRIAFARGAVVAGGSPIATDAAVRVALTANLMSSTQVGEVARQIAASPDRDEVELIAEAARLAPDQVRRLRRRVVAQRAARTFSVDRGEFVVDDRVTLAVAPGAEVDIRAVVYLGARTNLSEQRLSEELGRLGAWFQLKDDALDDLAYFGFTETDKPLLAALRRGADLAELEVEHRDLGERAVRAITYALACCGACEVQATPRKPPPEQPRKSPSQPPRTQSSGAPVELKRGMERPRNSGQRPTEPPLARTTTPPAPRELAPTQTAVAFVEAEPARDKPATTPPQPSAAEDIGFIRLKPSRPSTVTGTDAPTGGVRTMRTTDSIATRVHREIDQQAARETEQLIAEKIALVDAKVDHFELLGVARDAAPEAIRDAYFALARKLHPDRLASLAISDPKRDAQRLFAQINTAFATINDPAKRFEYLSVLDRGGEAVVRAQEAKLGEIAARVMRAEEVFRRAEMALRRDQLESALADFTTAAELQPEEPEYQVMLAWVKFAIAPDKKAVAGATRTLLTRTAEQMTKSVTARFYLGRVERMLGREREALDHFHEVLRLKPGHSEAASEARVLESRLKNKR
jgi:tetratricopeptide (TPR) repeat protein